MEKETALGIRVATEWALGLGCLIALIAGIGVLAKPAIVLLTIFGGLGFCAAAFEHGWLDPTKGKVWRVLKPTLIFGVICGVMTLIGFRAWPHEPEQVSILWEPPSPILTTTRLGPSQLNAKASVDADYVYNPTFGATLPPGTQTLSVTVIPKDHALASQVKTVSIRVNSLPVPAPPPPRPADKPDVTAKIVYPGDISLVLLNHSKVLVRDATVLMMLFDMDAPGDDPPDPLPIPGPPNNGSFIKPGSYVIPWPLAGHPNVKGRIKNGDRIFGWISVTCPDCKDTHAYWVFAIQGSQGGWYSECQKGHYPGVNTITKNWRQLRANLDANLDHNIPKELRVPITDDVP